MFIYRRGMLLVVVFSDKRMLHRLLQRNPLGRVLLAASAYKVGAVVAEVRRKVKLVRDDLLFCDSQTVEPKQNS